MTEEIGLFEAMYTQRAIRYLKPDAVPDELIHKILDAAIRAPSGGNTQRWAFLVIRDQETKRKIAERFRSARGTRTSPDMSPHEQRIYRGVDYMAQHLEEVPVFIVPCIRHDGSPSTMGRGASIYPAVQNILLAARGLGLGSVLTSRHKMFEDDFKKILGIPDDVETAALLPIGYLADGVRYGPNRRDPVEEVTFYDRWGNT